jgi:hypothetical protein
MQGCVTGSRSCVGSGSASYLHPGIGSAGDFRAARKGLRYAAKRHLSEQNRFRWARLVSWNGLPQWWQVWAVIMSSPVYDFV